jgi:hypothetical protein
MSEFSNGVRVQVRREFDLFPGGTFLPGETGVVVDVAESPRPGEIAFHVLLDRDWPGLRKWQNRVYVFVPDGYGRESITEADFEVVPDVADSPSSSGDGMNDQDERSLADALRLQAWQVLSDPQRAYRELLELANHVELMGRGERPGLVSAPPVSPSAAQEVREPIYTPDLPPIPWMGRGGGS